MPELPEVEIIRQSLKNPISLLDTSLEIIQSLGRMAMNDYEIVALVAGGHTFGKSHGAASESYKGPEPEGSKIQEQSTGYQVLDLYQGFQAILNKNLLIAT